MFLNCFEHASGRIGHVQRRRIVPVLQARPSNASAFTAAEQPLLPLSVSLVTGSPLLPTGLPPSYRTLTTDSVFRPDVCSDQQYAPGSPQLLSRHLKHVNPLHVLATWVAAQSNRLDLAFAAAMDRTPLVHFAAAAATAALTFMELHPLNVLQLGLPDAAAEWLEMRVGEWALTLVGHATLAVGLAMALWQLRNWVALQLALTRFDQVEMRDAAPAVLSPSSSVASSGEGTGPQASEGGPSSSSSAAITSSSPPLLNRWVPASLRGLFAKDWKGTDRTWLLALLVGRLSALMIAASEMMNGSKAFAAVCFAVSLLPLALPHIRQLLVTAPTMATIAVPGGNASLAVVAVLTDAAFLLAVATNTPAQAVAAVALAMGSGLGAVAASSSHRLTAAQAAPGDVATFHVVVRLPMSGTLIDTTLGHRPLTAVVGAGGSGSAGEAVEADSDPQARFRPLQMLLAGTELPGMYLGERRTVVLASGADANRVTILPFRNPGLIWWQPLDEMQRKVGSQGRELRAGDVFWYPVGSLVSELGARRLSTTSVAAESMAAAIPGADSWGPVEVVAVTKGWVQLDANAGMKEGHAEVEIQLVALEKKH